MVIISSPNCDKLIGAVTGQEVRSFRAPSTTRVTFDIFANQRHSF